MLSFNFKQCVYGKVYISVSGPDILGWLHQACLGLILRPGRNPQVTLVSSDVKNVPLTSVLSNVTEVGVEYPPKEFTTLFSEGLGRITKLNQI